MLQAACIVAKAIIALQTEHVEIYSPVDLKPAYKQTEVGVIPEEWGVKPLGECASFRTGPFGSALHKSDYADDGIPVVNPMHINEGRIEPTRTMTITEKAAKALSDFRLKAGEIVIGRRGDMGRCAVVQPEQAGWLCGTGSMIIRCGATDAGFLQRVLSSPRAIAAIEDTSVGSTMINLNQGTLAGLRLQFPPLPEQRAIATALSDVDGLLGGLDRFIAKKRNLKQAAMQQHLTGQTRLPGFHGEWEVKRLGAICEYVDGITTSGGDSGYLEIGDVNVDTKSYSVAQKDKLSVRGAVKVPAGTLLISTVRPTRGAIVITKTALHVSSAFCRVRPANGLLFHLVCQPKFLAYLGENSFGGTYPTCRDETILNCESALPSDPAEQTAIASVLSEMDGELAVLEQRRDKTSALKQAMMQELLTGKTRLV